MLTPEQCVVAAIATCLAGALLTLLVARHRRLDGWLAFLVTGATAAFILSAAFQVLVHGPSAAPLSFWAMPKVGFPLSLHVDGLTAVFLLLAVLIAVPAALYSISYMEHYRDYSVAGYYPCFLLFLAAMYGLLSTSDMMWFFFTFWQLMTLPGYALIRFEHRKPENARAANKYLVMMQVACAATMIGAELLAVSGLEVSGAASLKYDFDTVSSNLPLLLSARPGMTAVAFALFLIGFGIKMGMWPFGQFWLPDAHPAAPSPVSAMLSGVMIKTGVYGVMRYFLWLVPAGAASTYPLGGWGLVIALLGTITLFSGTAQALKQEQSKRLLAFHSIGQVGYILFGTGACMALLATGSPRAASLAALAFCGALLHVLNHGLFKGLLFFNSGSMLWATGTQDLNRMGGLMRFMPLTALTALVASFSISGVPLFNGFVSKWSIYVATVQGTPFAHWLAVCALIAILTSTITLASFIKFFGASFLSRTSSLVAERASTRNLEAPLLMQAPQIFLALACVVLGVLPAIEFGLAGAAIRQSRHGLGVMLANAFPVHSGIVTGLTDAYRMAAFVPLALLAVVAAMFAVSFMVAHLGAAQRRRATPWLCGYAQEAECFRYTAHNLYGEIKTYFRWLGGMPPVKNGRVPH